MKEMINQLGKVGMDAAQDVANSSSMMPAAPTAPTPVPVATAPPAVTPTPVADVAIPPVLDPLVQATNTNFQPKTQNAAINMYGDEASRGY
jgi:hypothetical protein